MKNKKDNDALYESVGNYTKFKIVELLIDNYRDKKLTNLNQIEELADDICKILAICGMKYYQELNEEFGDNEISN